MAQQPRRHVRQVDVTNEGGGFDSHAIVSDEEGRRLAHDVAPGLTATRFHEAIAEVGPENVTHDYFSDFLPDLVIDEATGLYVPDTTQPHPDVKQKAAPHEGTRATVDVPGLRRHPRVRVTTPRTEDGLTESEFLEGEGAGIRVAGDPSHLKDDSGQRLSGKAFSRVQVGDRVTLDDTDYEHRRPDDPLTITADVTHASSVTDASGQRRINLGAEGGTYHRPEGDEWINVHESQVDEKYDPKTDVTHTRTGSRRGKAIRRVYRVENRDKRDLDVDRQEGEVWTPYQVTVENHDDQTGERQVRNRYYYADLDAAREETLRDAVDYENDNFHGVDSYHVEDVARPHDTRGPGKAMSAYDASRGGTLVGPTPLKRKPTDRLSLLGRKWLGKAASRRSAHRASYTEDERDSLSDYGRPLTDPMIQAQMQGRSWHQQMQGDPDQAGVPDLPEDPTDEAHVAEHHSGPIVVSQGPVAPPRFLPPRKSAGKGLKAQRLPKEGDTVYYRTFEQEGSPDDLNRLRSGNVLGVRPSGTTTVRLQEEGPGIVQGRPEHFYDERSQRYGDEAPDEPAEEKALWRKLLPAEAGRFEKGHLPADFAKELAMGLLACKEFSGGVYVKARVRAPGGGISAKFTGTVKDSRGRTICFRNGKRCPCPKKQKAQGKGRPEAEYEEEELRGEGRPAPGQDRALPAMGPIAQLPPGQMVEASAIECEWYAVAGSLKVYDVCALSSFRSLNAALRDGTPLDASQAMTHARLQRLFQTAGGQQGQPQEGVAPEPTEQQMPQEQKGIKARRFVVREAKPGEAKITRDYVRTHHGPTQADPVYAVEEEDAVTLQDGSEHPLKRTVRQYNVGRDFKEEDEGTHFDYQPDETSADGYATAHTRAVRNAQARARHEGVEFQDRSGGQS